MGKLVRLMSTMRPTVSLTAIVAIAAVFTLSACKKQTANPPDLGFNYYPAEAGSWIVYDVDSIAHNDNNNTIDTFRFQLRETIESVFEDDEGRESLRIERYRRADSSHPWVLGDVWYSTRTLTGLEQVEENQRYLKLKFPPGAGDRWDGNAFNDQQRQDYEYTEVDMAATVNGNSFDSTLYVKQIDETNLIEIRFANERYARGVGMIFKEYTDLDLQTGAGTEVTMQVHSWGGGIQ